MGMPVIVEIPDKPENKEVLEFVFSYFTYVDEKFSTYKENSEITKMNTAKT